jgi:hypothetical protein
LRVTLKRHKSGPRASVDIQLSDLAADAAIVLEVAELENSMDRTAAISLVAERKKVSETTIYDVLSRARSARRD